MAAEREELRRAGRGQELSMLGIGLIFKKGRSQSSRCS